MQIRHAINLHKGTTVLVILALMVIYGNFTVGPWVYLSLHGTYGLLWLLKDHLFPDRAWNQTITWPFGLVTFAILALYWVAPALLISSGAEPPGWLLAAAITLNITGTCLHYGSDAQKHFTLKANNQQLITEGFFSICRNPNYLGEALTYLSFAMVAMHWIPYLILAAIFIAIFVPNMRRKDASLSRYPGFEAYRARTGLLLPRPFPAVNR